MQNAKPAPARAQTQAQATLASAPSQPQSQDQTAQIGQPSQTQQKTGKQHACVLCQQRKIKCDRNDPCSNCSKAKADCKFVPPAPRRRKRKSPEEELMLRVQQCELLLKKHGIDIGALDGPITTESGDSSVDSWRERSIKRPKDTAQTRDAQPQSIQSGRLIYDEGGTRYIEENLWNTVNEELACGHVMGSPSESSEANSWSVYPDGGSLLFGLIPPNVNLDAMHPKLDQQVHLWKAFQENFNCMFKIIHIPSTQQQLFEAHADLSSIPKSFNALIFAINNAAIGSMNNEDCLRIMGEPKSKIFPKYMATTQHALIQASLLRTSDFVVLQAFVIFLIMAQTVFDPYTLLILSGAAMRIAQRIGIHRDGTALGLPIFDTEMRRRLWWQIYTLDGQINRLAGTSSILVYSWDTKFPLNVDDIDLSPDMTAWPVEPVGRNTEMIICMLKCEMCKFMQSHKDKLSRDRSIWQNFTSNSGFTIEELDASAEAFEHMLQNKYLKYCDPLKPLHFLAFIIARSTLCKIKVIQHHPRMRPQMPPEELDMVITNTIKIIEYTNLVHSTKSLQKYFWHIRAANVQLETFIFLINELRTRTTGDLADRAWVQIQEVFEYCPEMITDTRNQLYVAMGNLILKAWDARTKAMGSILETPEFVMTLRAQRSANGDASRSRSHAVPQRRSHDQVVKDTNNDAPAATMPPPPTVEMSPLDWTYWDDLLHEFDMPFDVMNGNPRLQGGMQSGMQPGVQGNMQGGMQGGM